MIYPMIDQIISAVFGRYKPLCSMIYNKTVQNLILKVILSKKQ